MIYDEAAESLLLSNEATHFKSMLVVIGSELDVDENEAAGWAIGADAADGVAGGGASGGAVVAVGRI